MAPRLCNARLRSVTGPPRTLQKLRQATVRVEPSELRGTVEVDETYVGGAESGVGGRELVGKALVVIAVELDGKKVGRVRLRQVPNASSESLVGFLYGYDYVAKGSQVRSDDCNGYNGVQAAGFTHRVTPIHGDPARALSCFLLHVDLVASLLKGWLGERIRAGSKSRTFELSWKSTLFISTADAPCMWAR